ncbi:MAG: hypothetical protein U0840_02470 [Gemmataceae bacterium]
MQQVLLEEPQHTGVLLARQVQRFLIVLGPLDQPEAGATPAFVELALHVGS